MNENIPNNSIVVIANYNRELQFMNYSAIHLDDNSSLLSYAQVGECTQNVVAFIAIAHTLAHCIKNNIPANIYCNNQCAISWIKSKRVKTNLSTDSSVYRLLKRSINFINEEHFQNNVLQWNTLEWGPVSELFYGDNPA